VADKSHDLLRNWCLMILTLGVTIQAVAREAKMKGTVLPLVVAFCALASSCATAGGSAEQMARDDYQARPALTKSLFGEAGALSEDAVQSILTSKLTIGSDLKISALRFRATTRSLVQYYGYTYWRSEDYVKSQQLFSDALVSSIKKSTRVVEVAVLPDLLTPDQPTIPAVREAAIRTQSDLILVYRLTSDSYARMRIIGRDERKAFATCEAFLLDARTALIPFSSTVTRDFTTTKEAQDANWNETARRAENGAVVQALTALGEEIVALLDKVPSPVAPKLSARPNKTLEWTPKGPTGKVGVAVIDCGLGSCSAALLNIYVMRFMD
jgi:hypothetical protein